MNDFGLDRTGDEEIERMSVYDLRNVLMSKGITVSNKRKAELVVLAKAAIRLGLESNVEFHEDSLDLSERLTIKGTKLPDPFSIPINEFSTRIDNMPPFGIEDIFNFLIFKSSKYNRQKVASYKAFEEYGLFMDGYVEELILKETCGHFIFLGKVKPTMSKETRQGPTDKLCYWKKKELKSTGAAPVHDVLVVKSSSGMKRHAFKKHQVKLSHDELKTVKRKLKEFGSVAAMFIDSEDDTDSEIEIDLDDMEKQSKPLKPILIENVEKFLKEGGKEQDNFERQLALMTIRSKR
eukprot:gene17112-18837_t